MQLTFFGRWARWRCRVVVAIVLERGGSRGRGDGDAAGLHQKRHGIVFGIFTGVIAGSHKIKIDRQDIIAAAGDDPALIHEVIAPAGSTLLFGEALIHATGQIRSDRERVIVIGGYTPPMFQAWPGQEPSADYLAALEEPHRTVISGSASWSWKRRFRTLGMPRSHDF